MAFFSTTASKSIMLFLIVAAILSLVLLFSSHNSVAQARVERKLFGPQVVEELANGAARIGQNMLWNAGERTTLKFFGKNAQKGFQSGKKVSKFIDKMKDIAKQQCNNTFCITLPQKCEPCPSYLRFNAHCHPYCVLKTVDNNTVSCILPCGPPANGVDVSPSPSPMSLQVLLQVLYMVVVIKW